jgi:C-terminal processing protease CtpA/Prc
MELAKFSSVVKGNPGSFQFSKPMIIGSDNPDYFKGKVIILVNEQTQSTGEFLAMSMKLFPNANVLGSTTSGADGNVMPPFPLPGRYYT